LIAESTKALNLRKALLERVVVATLRAIISAVDRAPAERIGFGRLNHKRSSSKH
jgi:hypothetical protein